MIVPGSGMRIVVATRPVDFRKGHDALAGLVGQELGLDPFSGVVVFRLRRADRVKVLWWDGSGNGCGYSGRRGPAGISNMVEYVR